jgi:hypothetical protein
MQYTNISAGYVYERDAIARIFFRELVNQQKCFPTPGFTSNAMFVMKSIKNHNTAHFPKSKCES